MNDIESHYRVNMYIPSMEKVVVELESRFSENNYAILGSLGSIIFDDKPSRK